MKNYRGHLDYIIREKETKRERGNIKIYEIVLACSRNLVLFSLFKISCFYNKWIFCNHLWKHSYVFLKKYIEKAEPFRAFIYFQGEIKNDTMRFKLKEYLKGMDYL